MVAPRLCLLCVSLLGCAGLEPIALDVCGNEVLEAGEDCDLLGASPDSRLWCEDCRYRCDPERDCPNGWGCGADGLCRAPAAELERGIPVEGFTPVSFGAADVDGDGRADLVGAATSHVEVLRRDGPGTFGTPLLLGAPASNGPIALRAVDSDELVDVLLPTLEGISIWRGQRESAPLQVAAPGFVAPVPRVWLSRVTHSARPGEDLALALYDLPHLVARIVPPIESESQLSTFFASPRRLVDIAGEQLAIGRLHMNSTGDSIVFPFRGESLIEVRTVLQFGEDLRLSAAETIDLGEARACEACATHAHGLIVDRGAKFADVDGDRALDVLVGVIGPDGYEAVVVARGRGDGSLMAPYVDTRFEALGSGFETKLGGPHAPWPLAAADLNGDGVADYVGAEGIYFASTDSPHALELTASRPSLVPWSGAAIADVDGDQQLDVVAFAEATIDVLRCGETCTSGLFAPQQHITDAAVKAVRAGRLRGNAADDVVVLEGEVGAQVLSIMASTVDDWPAGPSRQAGFHAVDHLELMRWPRFDGVTDAFTDVLAGQRTASGARSLGVLHANAGGSLSSSVLLQHGVQYTYSHGAHALVGRFAEADSPAPDVAFVGESDSGEPRLWWLPGAEGALFTQTGEHVLLRDQLGSDFDLACAQFFVADVDGDAQDELVALTGGAPCGDAALTLWIGRVSGVTMQFTQRLAVAGGAGATLTVADLDDDQSQDVVIAAGPHVQIFWGGELGLTPNATLVPLQDGEQPVALTTIARAPRATGADRIALLTSDSLSLLGADLVLVPAQKVTGSALASADVNDDGLGDLLVRTDQGLDVWLNVAAPPLGDRR